MERESMEGEYAARALQKEKLYWKASSAKNRNELACIAIAPCATIPAPE